MMSAFLKESKLASSITTHIFKCNYVLRSMTAVLLMRLRYKFAFTTLPRVRIHLKRCSVRRPEAGLIGPLTLSARAVTVESRALAASEGAAPALQESGVMESNHPRFPTCSTDKPATTYGLTPGAHHRNRTCHITFTKRALYQLS